MVYFSGYCNHAKLTWKDLLFLKTGGSAGDSPEWYLSPLSFSLSLVLSLRRPLQSMWPNHFISSAWGKNFYLVIEVFQEPKYSNCQVF